jgi:predicted glycoside hydrolase/deacetylase ChbG (UPF0249 family)
MTMKQQQPQNRHLVITADDLGLSPEINRGIIDGYRDGVVTAASLLMNAPATAEGITFAKQNPGLQVGIHLGFVEGIALSRERNSLSDPEDYFAGQVCLHRHWSDFLKRYLSGRISGGELERELRLQIEVFLRHFPAIPFANGTQHLHLLPGILNIVIKLCDEYGIRWLRLPVSMPAMASGFVRRTQGRMMARFARIGARSAAIQSGRIRHPERFLGFSHSGAMSDEVILEMLSEAIAGDGSGVVEMMVHPGYEAAYLRRDLPWAYATFNWEQELAAVRSEKVRAAITAAGFRLGGFP